MKPWFLRLFAPSVAVLMHGDCATTPAPSSGQLEAAILELSDAVANLGRICEAVRYTAGLGKGQLDRIKHAQSLIAHSAR